MTPIHEVVRQERRVSNHGRHSNKGNTLTLAAAALAAPTLWLCHAALVWMHLL